MNGKPGIMCTTREHVPNRKAGGICVRAADAVHVKNAASRLKTANAAAAANQPLSVPVRNKSIWF